MAQSNNSSFVVYQLSHFSLNGVVVVQCLDVALNGVVVVQYLDVTLNGVYSTGNRIAHLRRRHFFTVYGFDTGPLFCMHDG